MNILTSILAGIILFVSGFGIVQYMGKHRLKTENSIQAEAIVHYEGLMYILPFDATLRERKDSTNEELNTTKHDTTLLTGSQRLWK